VHAIDVAHAHHCTQYSYANPGGYGVAYGVVYGGGPGRDDTDRYGGVVVVVLEAPPPGNTPNHPTVQVPNACATSLSLRLLSDVVSDKPCAAGLASLACMTGFRVVVLEAPPPGEPPNDPAVQIPSAYASSLSLRLLSDVVSDKPCAAGVTSLACMAEVRVVVLEAPSPGKLPNDPTVQIPSAYVSSLSLSLLSDVVSDKPCAAGVTSLACMAEVRVVALEALSPGKTPNDPTVQIPSAYASSLSHRLLSDVVSDKPCAAGLASLACMVEVRVVVLEAPSLGKPPNDPTVQIPSAYASSLSLRLLSDIVSNKPCAAGLALLACMAKVRVVVLEAPSPGKPPNDPTVQIPSACATPLSLRLLSHVISDKPCADLQALVVLQRRRQGSIGGHKCP